MHPRAMLAAALGMGMPLLLAGATGQVALGQAAALGSLAIGAGAAADSGMDSRDGSRIKPLAALLAPVAAAAAIAAAVAGHGALTDVIVILLAGAAASIGGYSHPLAMATTRFILFLIIATGAASAAPYRAGFVLLTLAGALWTCLLCLLIAPRAKAQPQSGAPMPIPTTAQRARRWQRTLSQWAGWQYTLRLVLGLGSACILRWLLPSHHFEWIALTVAILLQRQPEGFAVKATQRVAGTLLGVLGASLLLGHQLSYWLVAFNAGWLAGVRPLLRLRNYLAYSAAMTPLMVMIMGASRLADGAILMDRVAATAIGAVIALLVDRIALKAAGSRLLTS
ncbi:FUSC family protein [Cupriavidus sp. CV2]|uniref:FUSC family protein n=1 Tax=Cupriavidus ulmosensis TaxID=3065913 RepID=UPI00296B08FA|nr:FUSC family protein [Cupriavidus sp. CV2]MDW3688958.1 FUSC family protein [Cupriavidus sp. CV2]